MPPSTDARWALGNSRRATCLPEGKDARGSASGHGPEALLAPWRSDVAARARRLDDALDAHLVRGDPQRHAVVQRPAVHLAVGAAHDRAELVVDLALVPVE